MLILFVLISDVTVDTPLLLGISGTQTVWSAVDSITPMLVSDFPDDNIMTDWGNWNLI